MRKQEAHTTVRAYERLREAHRMGRGLQLTRTEVALLVEFFDAHPVEPRPQMAIPVANIPLAEQTEPEVW